MVHELYIYLKFTFVNNLYYLLQDWNWYADSDDVVVAVVAAAVAVFSMTARVISSGSPQR